MDFGNPCSGDNVGSSRSRRFHPDLLDRRHRFPGVGRRRLRQVWQGKQRTARDKEPSPIAAGRSRGSDHQGISAESETDTPTRGGFDRWADGSDRFVLSVTSGPIILLIVISMASLRVSIYRRCRQGCPRVFNRWPIQHHEGWSQYHPQHRGVWLRLRPSILTASHTPLAPDVGFLF